MSDTPNFGWERIEASEALAVSFPKLDDFMMGADEQIAVVAAGLAIKAPLASPALTGTPTAPTQVPGTNNTRLATTGFVAAAIASLVNSAPGVLDTLDEIAAALGDNPNFAATMTTALAGKQPLEATLTALAALSPTADKLIYATGNDAFSTTDLTAFARSILDDANAAAVRATLGLVIGTHVQGYDIDLASIASLTGAANKMLYATGPATWALADLSAFARTLLDDADAATMRATLGIANLPTGASIQWNAATPPSGFLEEDGSALSRTTYSALFGVIGTTHGVGDGSTTFNLPDSRGEFIRGWDHGRGVDVGRTLGSAQAEMVGPHNHPIYYNQFSNAQNGGTSLRVSELVSVSGLGNSFSTSGGNSGTENRPRNKTKMFCIKY